MGAPFLFHQDAPQCLAEFLPTSDYVGHTGVNANPLSLHFRFTARDGEGGVNSGDTTLLLTNTAAPFLATFLHPPVQAITHAGSLGTAGSHCLPGSGLHGPGTGLHAHRAVPPYALLGQRYSKVAPAARP